MVPGAAAVIVGVCQLDYSRPGKPDIDWDDPAAKEQLVSDLVNDALAVLAELTGEGAPERDAAAADALGLLALVAGQDVEPAGGSDGTDGRWRIARKVAPDRVISTVDREARHTRKCKSKRRDGFRGHVAAEPESGLITDCEMTMAAGPGSTDAENGVKMACRDRFHGDSASAGDGGDDAASAGQGADAGPAAAQPGPGTAAGPEPEAHPEPGPEPQPEPEREGTGEQGRADDLEVYGDSAYGSGEARAAYRDAGHDTVIKPKPLRPPCPAGSPSTTSPSARTTARSPACRDHPADEPRPDRDLRRRVRGLPAARAVHHRQGWPLHDHPPARGPAARRPRPVPDGGKPLRPPPRFLLPRRSRPARRAAGQRKVAGTGARPAGHQAVRPIRVVQWRPSLTPSVCAGSTRGSMHVTM